MSRDLRTHFEADLTALIDKVRGVPKREWLMYEEGQVYVRVMPTPKGVWLWMASVEMKARQRRRGHFTFVLDTMERVSSALKGRLFVENIQNDIVERMVKSRAYVLKDPEPMCSTYYKDFYHV